MSLKDWMKKVETSLVNEGTQTIMLPTLKAGSTAPTGEQTAVAIDTSKPGAAVAAAALGAKPGSTTTIANPNSPVKAIAASTSPSNGGGADNTGQQTTQTVGGTTQVSETGLDQVGSFRDQIKVEAKPQAGNKESLDRIRKNHPHECKMFEDGWGMDSSLFEALCDQYFEDGRIPRSVWHGSAEGLREFVEDCYAKDTMGNNQDTINNGMLDEDDMIEGSMDDFRLDARRADPRIDKYATNPKPSFMDKTSSTVGGALKKAGSAVMNKLHPSDEQLRSGPLDEEMSELERSLRESTRKNTMYEGKKSKKVTESGYSDKNPKFDIYVNGKYVASTNWAKTSEEAKKGWVSKHPADADKKISIQKSKKVSEAIELGDNELGIPKWYIVDTGNEVCGGPFDSREEANRNFKTSIWARSRWPDGRSEYEVAYGIEDDDGNFHEDDQAVNESVTKTKTGLKHKADAGGYGRKHEDDTDDNGKKPKAKSDEPKKGRGRPKSTDSSSGEDKKFDSSELNNVFGGKKPSKEVGKLSAKKRIATKADREEVDEAKLKGGQKKLDINKNGKLEKSDFAMLRGKKKKDAQMESWDRQLKGLLTEGMSVSTSTGQAGGEDSVSITATAADAGKLLQILQNAGLSGGAPAQASANTTSPSTGSSGGSAANADLNGSGSAVTSMPMPRGMAFSVQPAETNMPTAPVEVNVSDSEEVFNQLGKDHGQSEKSDNGDDALSFLKKAIGHSTEYADGKPASTTDSAPAAEPAQEETEEVEENDEDGKKPDEDGDGVPDWADKKPGKDDSEESEDDTEEEPEEDDSEESEESEEEKVDEGKESCNECGGLMEDDHECSGQLNEWSNSPQGQSVDEQFKTDLEFMQNIISGGLNKKKVDQTVMPHTKVKVTESRYTSDLRKLAGI